VSIEAEFIVNLGPYEHVKVTLSGENLSRTLMETAPDMPFGEALGDYHASLKAGVLYGRDKALEAVGETVFENKAEEAQPLFKQVEGEDLPNGNVAFRVHQGEPLAPLVDVPEGGQEDPVKLLTEGLGATVLEVREKPQEGPSEGVPGAAWAHAPDDVLDLLVKEEEKQSSRPWKNKPAAKKTKAWESEAPAAKPEPTKSDNWDW